MNLSQTLTTKFHQLKSNSAFHLVVAGTLTTTTLFLLNIGFARTFSKHDYGSYKQILLAIQFIIPLFTLGIPEGFKFLVAKDIKSTKEIFNSTIGLAIIVFFAMSLAGAFGLLGWIGTLLKNPLIGELSYTLPLFYILLILNSVLKYQAINENKSKFVIVSNFFAAIFLAIGGSYLILNYHSLTNGNRFFEFLIILLGIYYFCSALALFWKLNVVKSINFKINYSRIKSLLQFGIPLYLASYIGVLTLNIDKLIISNQGSTELFAVYAVGAVQIPLIGIISGAVTNSIFPKMVSALNSTRQEAKNIWMTATINTSYIIYPMIIALLLFSKPLILLLFGASYEEAIPVFRAYLLIMIWRNNSYGSLLTAQGKTKYITLYSVLTLILNAIFSYFLFMRLGIIGVVYGTFISVSFIAFAQLKHEKMLGSFFRRFYSNPIILFLLLAIFVIYYYLTFN